jgi:cell division protein FtsW
MQRILSFFGDTNVSENVQYQVNQAIIAFGNGGLFGVGPGQSRPSHLFLPESYGDFIFSIIGEEYGFVGALIIIAAFIILFLAWF